MVTLGFDSDKIQNAIEGLKDAARGYCSNIGIIMNIIIIVIIVIFILKEYFDEYILDVKTIPGKVLSVKGINGEEECLRETIEHKTRRSPGRRQKINIEKVYNCKLLIEYNEGSVTKEEEIIHSHSFKNNIGDLVNLGYEKGKLVIKRPPNFKIILMISIPIILVLLIGIYLRMYHLDNWFIKKYVDFGCMKHIQKILSYKII